MVRIMLAGFLASALILGAFVFTSGGSHLPTLHSASIDGSASSLAAASIEIVPCGNGEHGLPGTTNPCQACDLVVLGQNVIKFGVYIAVLISAVMFAVAGFMYLTSAGDEHKIEEGRSIFRNVFIGLLIVLLAWLIVDTIMKTLFTGNLTDLGPWNEIRCTPQAIQQGVAVSTSPIVTSGTAGSGGNNLPTITPASINSGIQWTQQYNDQIDAAAQQASIDPDVLRATLAIEQGNPNSQKQVGAQTVVGVGQMTVDTARTLDPSLQGLSANEVAQRLKDPSYNIQLTAQNLSKCGAGSDPVSAYACYNGGAGATQPSADCQGLQKYQCTKGSNNYAETRQAVPNFNAILQTIKNG